MRHDSFHSRVCSYLHSLYCVEQCAYCGNGAGRQYRARLPYRACPRIGVSVMITAVVRALAILSVAEKGSEIASTYMSASYESTWIQYGKNHGLLLNGMPFNKWLMAEAIQRLNITREEVKNDGGV